MKNTPTTEQQNMINATEGYIRCGAVPGSGKTFCITHRMARLIHDYFVDPSAIVALTFTNKAARSMTHRLKELVGDEGVCFTGTFHGYCTKILKEEIYRLSWPRTFKMLDKKGQIDLVTEVAERLNLSLKDYPAKNYLNDIAKFKSSSAYIPYMVGPDRSLLLNRISRAQTDVERVFCHYMLTQRDNFALDFHDMIGFAVYILQNYPDALAVWQDRCMYLLCDEYQDVNDIQDLLLALLSGKYHNLTVVGDDDQCIYGWRDSKVDFILDFDKKYPQARDFYLTENFRSTPEIVAVANSLIEVNQNRLTKAMFTNNPHGPKPVYNSEGTEREEALWIAYTIEQAVEQGKQYSDHAVLVRSSSQTRALEEAFMRKKIPYKILSGAEFYASEEIRTVLAYLSLVYALDDLDFTDTINRPKRKYGKKSVEKLREYAAQRNLTLMEALGEQIRNGTEKRQAILAYYNDVMRLHGVYQS